MQKTYIYILCLMVISLQSCGEKSKKVHKSKETTVTEIIKKPNILFLLADDLGYGELGSYGQKILETPVLDSLAREGMRFTNFYAGSAVCSPSRAVLMTGKKSSTNTIRANKGYYPDGSSRRVSLQKEDLTLAEMLGDNGYQTAFIGKWHLGLPDDVSSWAHGRGFQYAVQEQWSHKYDQSNFDGPMEYINGMQDSINFDYTKWDSHDDYRTNLALDYLDKQYNKDKPLFLFMSFRAPHGHEKVIGNNTLYMDKGWPAAERLHAAKINLLDKQVGRLLKKLDAMGQLENTLVIFTSDNGPHHEGEGHDHEFFNSNGALKGYKRDLYEGGIRVPMIAYWKGKINSNSTNNLVAGFQDFMPTLAEIANIETPKQSNGISILPVLLNTTKKVNRKYLNWETSEKGFRQSIRINHLKGVRYGVNSTIELYDMNTDISETKNIAAKYPELIQKIDSIFKNDRTENQYYPYGGKTKLKK
ncbi:arylsulfatase A-like enzyme [Maribacter vaceletii]|uniref:Arylsulfatase A-like enzyme n=1 Tax=Maribacter vaceletii TaxID=1206816 RepID=A0A495EEM6_9FLAO|nr:sulfatase-like hydrolase/transferase [Maribacter vaceletii]RKR14337.1 arylsulfatase A-like enzyme [Maribacter vaceletii]